MKAIILFVIFVNGNDDVSISDDIFTSSTVDESDDPRSLSRNATWSDEAMRQGPRSLSDGSPSVMVKFRIHVFKGLLKQLGYFQHKTHRDQGIPTLVKDFNVEPLTGYTVGTSMTDLVQAFVKLSKNQRISMNQELIRQGGKAHPMSALNQVFRNLLIDRGYCIPKKHKRDPAPKLLKPFSLSKYGLEGNVGSYMKDLVSAFNKLKDNRERMMALKDFESQGSSRLLTEDSSVTPVFI